MLSNPELHGKDLVKLMARSMSLAVLTEATEHRIVIKTLGLVSDFVTA